MCAGTSFSLSARLSSGASVTTAVSVVVVSVSVTPYTRAPDCSATLVPGYDLASNQECSGHGAGNPFIDVSPQCE